MQPLNALHGFGGKMTEIEVETEFKVIEISELNKGYLVSIYTTNKDRAVTGNKKLAFDDREREELLEVIKDELKML